MQQNIEVECHRHACTKLQRHKMYRRDWSVQQTPQKHEESIHQTIIVLSDISYCIVVIVFVWKVFDYKGIDIGIDGLFRNPLLLDPTTQKHCLQGTRWIYFPQPRRFALWLDAASFNSPSSSITSLPVSYALCRFIQWGPCWLVGRRKDGNRQVIPQDAWIVYSRRLLK